MATETIIINKKLLIISESIKLELTFEELVERYNNFLKNKARKWQWLHGLNEVFQVALIGLWEAYIKYDAIRGVTFRCFASKIIDYRIIDYINENTPIKNNKASKIKEIVSLNDNYFCTDGEGVELLNFVGEEDINLKRLEERLLIKKILNRFTEGQRKYIFAYLNGYKQKELAESEGITTKTVHRKTSQYFEKFKAMYLKESYCGKQTLGYARNRIPKRKLE